MKRTLATLRDCQCRYPVAGEGEQTRFCAAEVSAEQWSRGLSGDRYCDEHRALCTGRRSDADSRAYVTVKLPTRVWLMGAA